MKMHSHRRIPMSECIPESKWVDCSQSYTKINQAKAPRAALSDMYILYFTSYNTIAQIEISSYIL